MFDDPALKNHIQTKRSIEAMSYILAEWNMNDLSNIDNHGNYRSRPGDPSSFYHIPPNYYDTNDLAKYYKDATLSTNLSTEYYDNNGNPFIFYDTQDQRDLYFNLRQCFEPFRPRSGINKVIYRKGKYIDNIRSYDRPRYYMASREDTFKYWTSYRKTVGDEPGNISASATIVERGISDKVEVYDGSGYNIDDACPFVVYKEEVPANRIVVKMQTNYAQYSLRRSASPTFIKTIYNESIQDPLYNINRSSIPKRWKIQYLIQPENQPINENLMWIDAISFDENSFRSNGSPIVGWDGHVELYYGIKIPDKYKTSFHFVDYIVSESFLPVINIAHGESYIVGATSQSAGVIYIWNADDPEPEDHFWEKYEVEYGFSLLDTDDTKRLGVINSLVNPRYYTQFDENVELMGKGISTIYRDFVYLKGIRVVVERMYGPETCFDLIEMSPRLKANISNYTMDYNVSKTMFNDSYALPVGGLIASNGNINLFNHDGAFTENNQYSPSNLDGSLVSKHLRPNVKFEIYEAIKNVPERFITPLGDLYYVYYDKFVPIKTFYAENFPPPSQAQSISITLRDFIFRFESMRTPSIFLTNVSLTSALTILFDSIGFTNYVYKNFDSERFDYDLQRNIPSQFNIIIPYFFVQPDVTVAEVLNNLSLATQTSMFFDEYNSFTVMSKEYLLPTEDQRGTDIVLYGNDVKIDNTTNLVNIAEISSNEEKILNDGVVNYTSLYVQRSIASRVEAGYSDRDRTYVYKPQILWEAGEDVKRTPVNEITNQAGFALSAVSLNSDLSASVPSIVNNVVVNNVIDIGENVQWLNNWEGFLYANGEIIRYDGIEYSMPANVLSGSAFSISQAGLITSRPQTLVYIQNTQQYQNFFSKLPFGGSIFATGNVRIYTELDIEEYTDSNGVRQKRSFVKKHGRGQFNTPVVAHYSGLPYYWRQPFTSGIENHVRGCNMQSSFLFDTSVNINYTSASVQKPSNFTSWEAIWSVPYSAQTPWWPAVGTIASASPTIVSSNDLANRSSRTGIIKNHLRKPTIRENANSSNNKPPEGSIQSSAFVFTGANPMTNVLPRNFISYVFKELEDSYSHFGTRMRIIGSPKTSDVNQVPSFPLNYYNFPPSSNDTSIILNGGSGGIGIMVNPDKNYGYFFEIVALTKDNLDNFTKKNNDVVETVLHNVLFYKIIPVRMRDSSNRIAEFALPYKLWGGTSSILVDSGRFVGSDRLSSQDNPSVYDLAVEYVREPNRHVFYLYMNGSQIAKVIDSGQGGTPILAPTNKMCLFTRGTSQIYFDNVYALKNNYSKQTTFPVVDSITKVFGIDAANSKDIRRFGISGLVNSTYLSGIGSSGNPKYNIYYEEFGTIMRECRYFDIKFDRAFPAFISRVTPTITKERSHNISGYSGGSYGAKFLVFNAADRTITLSEGTGNQLTIQGITFTQQTTGTLSADEFLNEISDFSDPGIAPLDKILTTEENKKKFEDIKVSRFKYGKREFSLNSPYIQSYDTAKSMMSWIINNSFKKRRIFTLSVFSLPQIQLGDIVTIDYFLPEEQVYFIDKDKRFIISQIDKAVSTAGSQTTLKLVEI